MGVCKGEGGVGDRPRMGGGLWFWAKEVLVGSGGLGVSRNFPGKSSPSSLPNPFSPIFLPFDPLLQFLHPSKPSRHLSRSGCIALSTLFTLFFFLRFLPCPLSPFLSPYRTLPRTPSESLHRTSKRPQKAQNSSF